MLVFSFVTPPGTWTLSLPESGKCHPLTERCVGREGEGKRGEERKGEGREEKGEGGKEEEGGQMGGCTNLHKKKNGYICR